MTDITPKDLAYILALQGLLASGKHHGAEPIQTAYAAIDAVDALFVAIEKERSEKNKK